MRKWDLNELMAEINEAHKYSERMRISELRLLRTRFVELLQTVLSEEVISHPENLSTEQIEKYRITLFNFSAAALAALQQITAILNNPYRRN